jgi:hypothetical protein
MTPDQRNALISAVFLYVKCCAEEDMAFANSGCIPLAEIGKRVREARENTNKAWIEFTRILDALSEPSE